MVDSQVWDELALEVFRAARLGMARKDFEIRCRLVPNENGKSFIDRIRVTDFMLQENLVCLEDGCLKVVKQSVPDSLLEKLATGSEIAWQILECIDPPNKLARKLDLELLKRIGFNGEITVIKELESNLETAYIPKIRHVSLVDDSAGFDIQSPSIRSGEETVLLEVKTSVRPGQLFTFYISRNEARVGRQNPNWFLIGVEVLNGNYRVLGSISFPAFSDFLPLNQSEACEWETARISIPKKNFCQNLP